MEERILGGFLGLALGDAYGARFEGGCLERCLWRAIGVTRRGEWRWTDDTQMSIDIVESFLAEGRIDPDDLARRFSKSYRWSRGYGPGAAKVLKRIAAGADWREANRSVYAHGSFGNGAAMRAPIVGLIYANRPVELVEAARSSAIVTHVHPLAVEGAVVIARATASACRGDRSFDVLEEAARDLSQAEFATRFAAARAWLESGRQVSKSDVIRQLGAGTSAHESCVTAVYLALRFREQPFMAMLQFIASCGGDADTIGAMAGALWGAANGGPSLPSQWLAKLEQHARLRQLALSLHRRVGELSVSPSPSPGP